MDRNAADQLPGPEGAGGSNRQRQLHAGIEAQLVEHPHQISQFGIVKLEIETGVAVLAAHQAQGVAGARGAGADPDGARFLAEAAPQPAHQVAGVGQHHRDQGFQVAALPLQFRPAGPAEAPAGEDAQLLDGMVGGEVRQAFHPQLTALLVVDEGSFHRVGNDHRIQLAASSRLARSRS